MPKTCDVSTELSIKPTLLTVKETADILKTTPSGLYGHIHRGTAPPYIKYGRSIRFDLYDLQSWLEHKKIYSLVQTLRK